MREAYDAETVDWRMHGMTMRVVPRTYGDLLEFWDHHVENVLELTRAAQGLIDYLCQPWRMDQPWLLEPLWQVAARVGGLPARDLGVQPAGRVGFEEAVARLGLAAAAG
ncbi:hypothetical protein GCM10011584_33870 [Nocardioides phosphati]|uniref:ER-bound oxygenase mpaB/mpaB'/Rubber oxygenase catalytic domain-containing protein n=1 Tax=Nocardioides phosphati TaxID=1867775 RepID=A0ABQ2NF32_9ACTN|nr:hypothetical protein GCM10011584_33870 [Nocardioides phosphati]